MPSDELLTAEELAERLRVKPDTIRQWSRSGRIPTIRITAKVVRYDLSSVMSALKADKTTAEGEVQHG